MFWIEFLYFLLSQDIAFLARKTSALMVRSPLSVPGSGVNRPTKYTASGARGQFWVGKA
jgi:hypothetical protein